MSARSTDLVYSLDAEAGQVRFGDGLRGARPTAGARLVASYQYGGGRLGNVGIGVIKASRDPRLQATLVSSREQPLNLSEGGCGGTADARASGARVLRDVEVQILSAASLPGGKGDWSLARINLLLGGGPSAREHQGGPFV